MRQTQIPLQRKKRERQAKRAEILSAARKVFATKGYERATLDEIAELAEFAKGTLYNYFDSKETLFREIVESILDEMIHIAEQALAEGGPVRDQFCRYAVRTLEYYRTNEDLLHILVREIHRTHMKEDLSAIIKRVHAIASVLASALRREMNKRLIIKDDPAELAHVFVGMIHNRAMRRSFTLPGLTAVDCEAEATFLTRLFFDGAARS
ncbi:MAG: hypothetical protein C4326_03425 [Ignavibacteria bacterium]